MITSTWFIVLVNQNTIQEIQGRGAQGLLSATSQLLFSCFISQTKYNCYFDFHEKMLDILLHPYVILISFLIFVLNCLIIKSNDRIQEWKQQGLNGQHPWMTVIRLFNYFFFSNPHLKLGRNIRKYGKVYYTREVDRCSLVVSDPQVLKDVLASQFSHFMDRRKPMGIKYMDTFLTQQSGSEWKHNRSIVSPTFTSGKMKAMVHLMQECLQPMMNRIRRNNGMDIEMKDLFGCFTMDVIAKCAFAVDTCTHDDDKHPFVISAKNFLNFRIWRLFFVMILPKFIAEKFKFSFVDQSSIDYIEGLGRHMIEERKKAATNSDKRSFNDFLHLMLEAAKEQEQQNGVGSKSLSDEEIISNILFILIAGMFSSYCCKIYWSI